MKPKCGPPVDFEVCGKSFRLKPNGDLHLDDPVDKPANAHHASKKQLDVPEARFTVIDAHRKAKTVPFALPSNFVRYRSKEAATDDEGNEYDVDEEDIAWLSMANARRRKVGLDAVEEEAFERAIDRLEKESHFEAVSQGASSNVHEQQTDDDAPCCICHDREDSNTNQIIFCDMCNIAVHQDCYGVPYIPEGQWLCKRCQFSPSSPVRCELCPYTGGAFKQTTEGRWAHVACVLWINEAHFGNAVFLEPVEGVEFALKRRSKLCCLVCKKKMGASVQCTKRSCCRAFHASCAHFAGFEMSVKEETSRKGEKVINRYVLCDKHTIESGGLPKRQVDAKIKEARKMISSTFKQTPNVVVPVISHKALEEIGQELQLDSIEDIRNYWALKRKSRAGVQLIRRLQVYQKKSAVGQLALASDGGLEAANLPADTRELLMLRSNFEKCRLLAELVKKREKKKNEFVDVIRDLVANALKSVTVVIHETLDKMVSKDFEKVFTQPVSDDDVAGYSDIIKKPMDLQTMRSKADGGQYKKVADLAADFKRMMDNCCVFNKNNKHYWDYGQRFKGIGARLLQLASIQEERINKDLAILKSAANTSMRLDGMFGFDDRVTEEALVGIEKWMLKPDVKSELITHKNILAAPKRSTTHEDAPNGPKKRKSGGSALTGAASARGNARKRALNGGEPKDQPEAKKAKTRIDQHFPALRKEISDMPQLVPSTSVALNEVNGPAMSRSYAPRLAPATTRRTLPAPAGRVEPPQTLRESFRQPRKVVRYGDLTEASSASDTGGFTSADEEPASPGRVRGSKRRLTLPLIAQNASVTIEPDIEKFEHKDIVWVSLEGRQRMPAQVVDPSYQATFHTVPSFLAAVLHKRPLYPAALVVLFDKDDAWDDPNSWLWVRHDHLKSCNPEMKENGAGREVYKALQRARAFHQESIQPTC